MGWLILSIIILSPVIMYVRRNGFIPLDEALARQELDDE